MYEQLRKFLIALNLQAKICWGTSFWPLDLLGKALRRLNHILFWRPKLNQFGIQKRRLKKCGQPLINY